MEQTVNNLTTATSSGLIIMKDFFTSRQEAANPFPLHVRGINGKEKVARRRISLMRSDKAMRLVELLHFDTG